MKNGRLTANKDEEIPRNNIFLDTMCTYQIFSKRKKENVSLKYVTTINPIMGWFKIM